VASYIDMDEILPDLLYQGSKPPWGTKLRRTGLRVLVLAAEEHQPPAYKFPGVRVVHAPLDDHLRPLTRREWSVILSAAEFVADRVLSRRPTLVTCAAGLNRSGIINAAAVTMITGCSGAEAVELIRSKREWALSNSSFADHVDRMFP
jgi:hypothetical protein